MSNAPLGFSPSELAKSRSVEPDAEKFLRNPRTRPRPVGTTGGPRRLPGRTKIRFGHTPDENAASIEADRRGLRGHDSG